MTTTDKRHGPPREALDERWPLTSPRVRTQELMGELVLGATKGGSQALAWPDGGPAVALWGSLFVGPGGGGLLGGWELRSGHPRA